MSKVLVAEISGKRAGDSMKRPTERFAISYDKIIVSNNSDGYITDWDIVNVPDEYRDWYVANFKNADNNAWYAPMNRSYAIKYAREHGYDYLVQLDDNIKKLEIKYSFAEKVGGCTLQKKYCSRDADGNMMNDFIDMAVTVLQNTNAGICGFNMLGASVPNGDYIAERYCYSLFAMALDRIPSEYQGDFEDDIEYRLKMRQMGIPMVQICCMRYGKVAALGNKKDESGCRIEYNRVGVNRGEQMRKLYGDVYSAGMSNRSHATNGKLKDEQTFKHKMKKLPKLGILCTDKETIDNKMRELLSKYAKDVKTNYKLEEAWNGEDGAT